MSAQPIHVINFTHTACGRRITVDMTLVRWAYRNQTTCEDCKHALETGERPHYRSPEEA